MSSSVRFLPRAGRIVREVLLTCAALGGAICIVFSILAFAGGYSLMLFKTGSMAPTIPAGSVALVQRVPASDLTIGDVVTVDRAGALPITHRITGIEAGTTADERVITLRGDANATDDPAPYTIEDARIVRGSVPHLAPVIAQFGNPWVLGGLTLGAALLVSWAFWPRRADEEPPDADTEDEAPGDQDAGTDDVQPAPHERRPALRAFAVVVLAGATIGPAIALAPAPAASAATAGYLTVQSDLAGAGVQTLDPVDPLFWHLDVDALAAPADGELDIAVSATGDARFGLQAEVRACDAVWASDGSCPAGEALLYPRAPLPVDGAWTALWNSATPDAVHLRIALTADPADAAAGETGASVTVRATAAGETVDSGVDGEQELPPTGGPSLALFAAPAAVLLGVGAALAARRRSGGRSRT